MNTKEILNCIKSNGGFCNLNKWNAKEIAQYIKGAYNCSYYVAKNVSFYLSNK